MHVSSNQNTDCKNIANEARKTAGISLGSTIKKLPPEGGIFYVKERRKVA